MRKWHRWLAMVFGVFLLWIAVTGVLSQAVPWFVSGPAPALAQAGVPAGFVCPASMTCRPKAGGSSVVGLLHHLHSGESFGPLGVAISVMSGLALVFFCLSGLWMYWTMWRNRARRRLKPRWFWR